MTERQIGILGILFALLAFPACATSRQAVNNCQPVLRKERLDLNQMINDSAQEWMCDRPWWQR